MKQVKRWFVIALTLCGLVAGGLFIAADWESVTEPEMPPLMVQGLIGGEDDQGDKGGEDDQGPGAQGDGYTWSG